MLGLVAGELGDEVVDSTCYEIIEMREEGDADIASGGGAVAGLCKECTEEGGGGGFAFCPGDADDLLPGCLGKIVKENIGMAGDALPGYVGESRGGMPEETMTTEYWVRLGMMPFSSSLLSNISTGIVGRCCCKKARVAVPSRPRP